MPSVTGMSAADRRLSDTCKRALSAALGHGAADEVEVGLETSVGVDQVGGGPPAGSEFIDPTLTGIVQLGLASDLVGFFGAPPTGQPAAGAPAPDLTAQVLSYVGTPDLIIGDSGNLDENNRLACLAAQINALVADLTAVHGLVNQLVADLISLGILRGA